MITDSLASRILSGEHIPLQDLSGRVGADSFQQQAVKDLEDKMARVSAGTAVLLQRKEELVRLQREQELVLVDVGKALRLQERTLQHQDQLLAQQQRQQKRLADRGALLRRRQTDLVSEGRTSEQLDEGPVDPATPVVPQPDGSAFKRAPALQTVPEEGPPSQITGIELDRLFGDACRSDSSFATSPPPLDDSCDTEESFC